MTDAELLSAFIAEQCEDAFTALVRRHGPMVLATCKRILGNVHDAEDGFQAAFLVLARKAWSIRPRERVGQWLYGVAYRTSLELRRKLLRRRATEKSLNEAAEPRTLEVEDGSEALDRELQRLPRKYRDAIVLCHLQGRSRSDAARMLQIPEGTLSSRLAMGRKLLRCRLERAGICLSSAGWLLCEGSLTANPHVPVELVVKTVRSLSQVSICAAQCSASAAMIGVLKTMMLANAKTTMGVLLSITIVAGGALLSIRASDGKSPGKELPATAANPQEKPAGQPKGKTLPPRPLNPIDEIIVRKWIEAGMKETRRKQREELLKRLSLDLRGLPPSAEQLKQIRESKDVNAAIKLGMKWLEEERQSRRKRFMDSVMKDVGKKSMSKEEQRLLESAWKHAEGDYLDRAISQYYDSILRQLVTPSDKKK